MLTYGFFNAVYTEGIPDRSYTADNLAEFFDSIIGDGVSADIQDGFKVLASSGMQVNLNPGFCWIHGYYAKNTSMYPLVVSAAPPTDTRIDAVVLRWSRADRNILPQVLTGVASPNPQRPQIVRNADTYDLLLGYITLSAGESAITSDMITDTRADVDVCGIIDTFASRLLPDGSVTREKLANDALYSPITKPTTTTYNVVASDLGKTIVDAYSTRNNNLTWNLSKSLLDSSPIGTEIAFARTYTSQSITLNITGARIINADSGQVGGASQTVSFSLPEKGSMCALKKLENDSTYGSFWILTGNAEVIS